MMNWETAKREAERCYDKFDAILTETGGVTPSHVIWYVQDGRPNIEVVPSPSIAKFGKYNKDADIFLIGEVAKDFRPVMICYVSETWWTEKRVQTQEEVLILQLRLADGRMNILSGRIERDGKRPGPYTVNREWFSPEANAEQIQKMRMIPQW